MMQFLLKILLLTAEYAVQILNAQALYAVVQIVAELKVDLLVVPIVTMMVVVLLVVQIIIYSYRNVTARNWLVVHATATLNVSTMFVVDLTVAVRMVSPLVAQNAIPMAIAMCVLSITFCRRHISVAVGWIQSHVDV